MKKTLSMVAVVAALVAVPAALAEKPSPKPIASEKTWVKVGGGKSFGTVASLSLTGLSPLKPASAVTGGLRFPIVQGKLILTKAGSDITDVRGSVGHVGGVTITNGDKAARIRNLILVANRVGATDASKLTGMLAGKRIVVATITLGTVTNASAKVTVPITHIDLTSDAAAALNAALGTSLAAGDIGAATLKGRVVGRGKAA
jgi:hypothetical protein